jgi:ribosomal protein S14
MKKLIEKDKKLRKSLVLTENKHFILKTIIKNSNFFILIRWNAFLQLKLLTSNINKSDYKYSTTNRCLLSSNKKRFNKLTGFSRQIFLKIVRSGSIPGIKKSSW